MPSNELAPEPADRHRSVAIDVVVGVVLAAAATWLYAATALGRIYGNDGAMLAEWTALPERAFRQYHNTLYLPAASLLRFLMPPPGLAGDGDPIWLAKTLSILPAGLGIACVFGICRLLGAARAASVAATLLLAVSPLVWFFGVAIEVHALHFLLVSACALLTLLLPWRRPWLATAGTATLFVVPYLSHQSAPTLGPCWVLLVQCARRRVASAFGWPTLCCVGAALLLALLVGHGLVQWHRGLGFGAGLRWVAETVGAWRRPFSPAVLWHGVVQPLGLLLPVVLLALGRRAVDPWLRAAVAAVYVPLIGSIAWWGVPERGGYLIGPAFVLAALAARWLGALPRRVAQFAAPAAVLLQAGIGFVTVRAFDREGGQLEDRVRIVHEQLGDRGFVLSCNDNAPPVTVWLPGVQELDLLATLANDAPPDAWVAGLQPVLQALAVNERVLLDRSYRRRDDLVGRQSDGVERLEGALAADWLVTELDDASWPCWLLTRR